jgi:hypothetical protein
MQTGALLPKPRTNQGFKRLEDNVGLNFIFRVSCLAVVVGSCPYLVPAQTPVFRATTNLQSIAVQVVDKKGNFVPGLTVTISPCWNTARKTLLQSRTLNTNPIEPTRFSSSRRIEIASARATHLRSPVSSEAVPIGR